MVYQKDGASTVGVFQFDVAGSGSWTLSQTLALPVGVTEVGAVAMSRRLLVVGAPSVDLGGIPSAGTCLVWRRAVESAPFTLDATLVSGVCVCEREKVSARERERETECVSESV